MSDQVPKIFTLDGGLALKTSGTKDSLDLFGKWMGFNDKPKMEVPTAEPTPNQSASYGASIPYSFGRICTFGNIFWMRGNSLQSRLTIVPVTSISGGKGGGKKQAKWKFEIVYEGTVAISLCVNGFRGTSLTLYRIWLTDKLIFSNPTGIPITIGSNKKLAVGGSVAFYDGTQTFSDSTMEAFLGSDNCPDYNGLVYIVIKNLPLAKFGNSLQGAAFKCEIGPATGSPE